MISNKAETLLCISGLVHAVSFVEVNSNHSFSSTCLCVVSGTPRKHKVRAELVELVHMDSFVPDASAFQPSAD